jgi:hydrophobic/amphiphilic exporter-1 (mainly G- bacteria), HAE1 family
MKGEPIAFALPRFSVTRPVTVVMILLAILVVGYIAYSRIPVALFPEGYEQNSLGVFIPYPNTAPRDIEEKITRPVEGAVGTMPHVKRIVSFANNGVSFTRVEFQNGTDLKNAYATLRDRMDRLMPELPDDVDRIWLRRWDQNDIPIIYLVAALPPEVDDPYSLMDNIVRPALQRIEGVGNVDVWGLQSRQVQIELDDQRLRSHRVDPNALVASLRNQNETISGGYVIDGGRKVYVRSLGRFETPEEIANLVVDPAHRLRLRDIADVGFKASRREWAYRVDRKPAVGIEITRESSGNIERISRETRETLAELGAMPQLSGVKFDVFWDQGRHVRESIDNLKNSAVWGGLFAATIIYTFLRAPRMTGILTLSIPLSLLCSVIVLFFMGWTLNMATMMGLLLSVGMVVDNSIVIVENVYRRRQEGLDATRASILGAGEVGLAVVMATLTTVVVFLPLILMSDDGEFSFWMLRIGMPVITSLLASLVIALVFVPLAAQRLSRGSQHGELRVIGWLRERYLGALRWVLAHRLDAAILVIAALISVQYPMTHIRRGGGGGGGDGENTMWFFFELPTGTALEETDAFFGEVEAFLLANAPRYNIDRVETRFRNNMGRVQARFKPDPNNQWYEYAWDALLKKIGARAPLMERHEIEKDFNEKFVLPPGVTSRSTQRGGNDQQDSMLRLNLYGEDTNTLLELAEGVTARLRSIPGLLSVDTDLERGSSELRIQLDRDRARQLGINPQDVSSSISYTMRGLEVGRYYTPDGRELRIQVQLGDVDRARLDDVRNLTFRTESGVDVPLETMAELEVTRTLGQIRREARQTMLSVTARAPQADSRQLFAAIDQAMAGFEMPRGYRWDKGGRFGRLQEEDRAMKFALILAITFVFLLMGLLFESFVLPLAVIIAVPFSFFGVYWTLYLTNTELNIMAMIGVVILIGVVVNNAIVLVDLTNRLRSEGLERFEALMTAGRHRFRPILMTTLTTVCGLIPMAVGNAKMVGMPYAPLGRAMIGGLLASTVLTLIVVPLFYTFLDDLREYIGGIARSAFHRGSPALAPAASAVAAKPERAGG